MASNTVTIRTLIVDDEDLARDRLRQLLELEPGMEVVGECADGREAVAAIRQQQPDLIFLDIQMPELDGFGVLEAVGPEAMPLVVFVTAYDQFALRAFEVHALDYLLKPFDRERFRKALGRARNRLEQTQERGQIREQLSALLTELKSENPEAKAIDRLAIKSEGRVVFVKVTDIDWVEAADNYVNLHVAGGAHLMRETMSSLEGRLPGDKFLRISRSTIVNIERIKELQPLFHGEYAVILRNGTRLTLSRGYRDKLSQLGLA
jgi:two-component system LytT family response regulator